MQSLALPTSSSQLQKPQDIITLVEATNSAGRVSTLDSGLKKSQPKNKTKKKTEANANKDEETGTGNSKVQTNTLRSTAQTFHTKRDQTVPEEGPASAEEDSAEDDESWHLESLVETCTSAKKAHDQLQALRESLNTNETPWGERLAEAEVQPSGNAMRYPPRAQSTQDRFKVLEAVVGELRRENIQLKHSLSATSSVPQESLMSHKESHKSLTDVVGQISNNFQDMAIVVGGISAAARQREQGTVKRKRNASPGVLGGFQHGSVEPNEANEKPHKKRRSAKEAYLNSMEKRDKRGGSVEGIRVEEAGEQSPSKKRNQGHGDKREGSKKPNMKRSCYK